MQLFELDVLALLYLLHRRWYPAPGTFCQPTHYATFREAEGASLLRHLGSGNPQAAALGQALLESELDPQPELPPPFTLYRVTVLGARGLLGKERNGKSNPYVTIQWVEGWRLTSAVMRDELEPLWHLGFPL
jgi:hypothetical protein